MSKQKILTNDILCKDCRFSYDPDPTHLDANKQPILTHCKYSEHLKFYKVLENCDKAKRK